jgi:SAM-dependent methyltransferase
MASEVRAVPDATRFLPVAREHLRTPQWGHPLAHIIRELRDTYADLIPSLDLGPRDVVVDYGCADQPYRDLFGTGVRYLGADLPGNPDATIEIAPDGSLPIDDGRVAAVVSSQVLEHVADPAFYLAECARVLRPGGKLLLSTHGIMVYHRDPVDYWRWTGEGLQRIVALAGLRIVRFEGVMGLAATGVQLFQDGTHQRVPRRLLRVYFAVMQRLVALFDRNTAASKADNALVFALVAEKPRPLAPVEAGR